MCELFGTISHLALPSSLIVASRFPDTSSSSLSIDDFDSSSDWASINESFCLNRFLLFLLFGLGRYGSRSSLSTSELLPPGRLAMDELRLTENDYFESESDALEMLSISIGGLFNSLSDNFLDNLPTLISSS